MKIYLAPMEGITNFIFRRVYLKHFGGIDLSYTPFIVANQTYSFKTKEKHEIIPYDERTVPQILSNNPDAFIHAAGYMKDLGYKEVNLNLGCPSPTVSGRGRGAGMLKDIEKLDAFLDKVFSAEGLPAVSVKTRAGVEDPAEVNAIAKLYKKYPFDKIIVHPRLLKDYYKGCVRRDCFRVFYENFEPGKLVFNGDINTAEDAAGIAREFPGVDKIMTGRGLLSDPLLPEKIRAAGADNTSAPADAPADAPSDAPADAPVDAPFDAPADAVERIFAFLDELWDEYAAYLSGEADVLAKMKELWSYLYRSFDDGDSILKAVRKARTKRDYIRCCREHRSF